MRRGAGFGTSLGAVWSIPLVFGVSDKIGVGVGGFVGSGDSDVWKRKQCVKNSFFLFQCDSIKKNYAINVTGPYRHICITITQAFTFVNHLGFYGVLSLHCIM